MENLYIAPSVSTPEVSFEPGSKTLFFIGQSYPADSFGFYKPLFDWLERILVSNEQMDDFKVIFKLKYYNTSSSKQFAKFFKLLEDSKLGEEARVYWYYSDYDTDMLEAGYRFSSLTELKFELRELLPS